ncbi:hypothetical protein [Candidatus Methylacidiphilum infernorum]|uniref:hypothetical protein n=1 Tax=Candidatus Methylacidiphilum infernorum TaxID=511746 RepID=UPI00164FF72C|nr:hypothetical protein [Candidatus Methylacidiphilum infernorum]
MTKAFGTRQAQGEVMIKILISYFDGFGYKGKRGNRKPGEERRKLRESTRQIA